MSSHLTDSWVENEKDVRRRLVCFYEKHNPRQLKYVDTILFAYRGHWDELFVELAEKYERGFWQPDTATPTCPCPSNHDHPADNDFSLGSSSCQESDGSAGSSSFKLLDPMDVVQRRRSGRGGGDTQHGSIAMFHGSNSNNMSQKGGNLTLLKQSSSGDAQDSIVRRLRLQQLFMRLAPKEVLRMEEFMAQYREAYMMEAGSCSGRRDAVTEEEWQEAMIRDLLHEVDPKKAGNRNYHKPSMPQQEVRLKPLPSSFTSRVLFPFHPADPLEVKSTLGPKRLQGLGAPERGTPDPGRGKGRKKTMTSLLVSSQPPLTPNTDERMWLHVETCVDEWCEPLEGHSLANATEGFLTSEPEKPHRGESTLGGGPRDVGEPGETGELNEKEDFSSLSIIVSHHTHGEGVCMVFSQTREEQRVEGFLSNPAVRCALDSPLFHYRLFLLLCTSMEGAQGEVLSSQGDPTLALPGAVTRVPYWEPSLTHRVLWRCSASQDNGTLFLPNDTMAGTLPYDFLDALRASRSIIRTIGLEFLWRNEVTFADVVAVRMRYFTRRYAAIRWLVLRPFAGLRSTQERIPHSRLDVPQWEGGANLNSLLFIDAVSELSRVFGGLSQQCWTEFIGVWKDGHDLLMIIAALRDELFSQNSLDDMSELRPELLEGAEKEDVSEGENGTACRSRMPRSALMLLSCTAFLCLHVDRPFGGISFVDIFATYHCLRVAAIVEEEHYRRLLILQAWGEACDSLHHLEGQSAARVSLQEREHRQRGMVEVQESSTRMELFQSVFLWFTWRSRECRGSPEAPSPHPMQSATAVEASFSQPVVHWRREAMRRRLQAFFRSASERQRCLKESARVQESASSSRGERNSRIVSKQ